MKRAAIYMIVFILLLSCGKAKKRRQIDYSDSRTRSNITYLKQDVSDKENIIYMEQESGVKYVWIEVNGIKLRFVFDTGASSICISSTEAKLLYKQGTLKEEDFIGVERFQDATGRISKGMKINLRSVKVGNVFLENVEATVIDNVNAPLLLGQTVLERFGKIEIDNENSKIILK